MPGNITMTNWNLDDNYATIQKVSATIANVVEPFCVPDDDLEQHFLLENTTLALRNNELGFKMNMLYSIVNIPHYRSIILNLKNGTMYDFNYSPFANFYYIGSEIDEFHLTDWRIYNSSISAAFMVFQGYKNLTFTNLKLEQMSGNIGTLASISIPQEIHFSDITLDEYIVTSGEESTIFSLVLNQNTVTKLSGINVINSSLSKMSLFNVPNVLEYAEVSDGYFKDTDIGPDSSVISFISLGGMVVSHMEYVNVTVTDLNDVSASLIELRNYDLSFDKNITLQSITLSETPVTLFTVNSIVNNGTENQAMTIQDLKISNATYTSRRILISTESLITTSNLSIIYTKLSLHGLKFIKGNHLFNFAHSTKIPVLVSNSEFYDMESPSINIQGVPDQKVSFLNNSFYDIFLEYDYLITSGTQASLQVSNCSFTSISAINDYGIIRLKSKGVIIISDSVFTENSAFTSTLFHTSDTGKLYWNNCTMSRNFAVTASIVNSEGNGIFEFSGCSISNNYAIVFPLSKILDVADPSIISNSEIHDNVPISSEEFLSEVNDCQNLCFIDQRVIEFITSNDLHILNQDKELFQVILGHLIISNSTKISRESVLVHSFLSTVEILDSVISSISFDVTSFELISTTFIMQNVQVSEITSLSNKDFILATFDSMLHMQNITVEDSQTLVFRALQTEANVENITFTNISASDYVFKIESSTNVSLNDILIDNCQTTSVSLVDVFSSQNVSISNFEAENSQNVVLDIKHSQLSDLVGLNIHNTSRAITMHESTIDNLTNSHFSYNGDDSEQYLGAIWMQDSSMNITNSSFSENRGQKGGAIAFQCRSLAICHLQVSETIFENNSATVQGGAINYDYKRPTLQNITFLNNSAPYGTDISGYPVKIRVEGNSDDRIELNNIGSGITVTENIFLALVDYDNQTMILENSSQISIFARNSSSARTKGTNTALLNSGISYFDNIIFISNSGDQNVEFYATSKAIDSEKVRTAFGGSVSNNTIFVNFRECKPGEEVTADNQCSK